MGSNAGVGMVVPRRGGGGSAKLREFGISQRCSGEVDLLKDGAMRGAASGGVAGTWRAATRRSPGAWGT